MGGPSPTAAKLEKELPPSATVHALAVYTHETQCRLTDDASVETCAVILLLLVAAVVVLRVAAFSRSDKHTS